MGKTFWAILAVIVVIFGGILVFNKDEAKKSSGSTAVKATNHVIGSTSTGVKLVEYGDYECPVCGRYYPLVEQVKEKYKDKIQFQFRNLPLITVHKQALLAARTAEAAGKQGKYWEMYNLLFQNQANWSQMDDAKPAFEQYATQLGLNVEQFKKDVADPATNEVVQADIDEFKKTGERMATPTFFLDGKSIKPASVEEFSKLIDDAIKAKEKN